MRTPSHNRLLFTLVMIVIAMFGFGFALIPIYNVMCKSLGINGKPDNTANSAAIGFIDKTRSVTIEFLASRNENLPWDFYPLVKKITLHPGENKVIAYYAKNNTDKTMTIQAIPSIMPGQAAKHLKKTECFCFTKQTFKAHEGRTMPVLFHIDAELPRDINTVTLSYTMFDTAKLLHPIKVEGHPQ